MSEIQALLSRQRHAPRPSLPIAGPMALDLGRVHEICGPARRLLALAAAAAVAGPVLWIVPAWTPERLNGEGLCPWIDPGRLILAEPQRAEDLLWCMEEGLRAGAVALVVADLPDPPGLTPVRRLHLAAETGSQEGRVAPLGLLMTPGNGGAQGVESRWHLAPQAPDAAGGTGRQNWRLERRRARSAPPAGWTLTRAETGPRHRLVTAPARPDETGPAAP